ncbi:WD40 repeat-like protein [Tuber magnatum]|uniref:WD40 repeat-like protein n=1 Tax=Tuber magnatum TaxID=42249 RepID=A0A317SPT5_9PEZI|nr:WD40 repeat-like protein [Tuber magnatum]
MLLKTYFRPEKIIQPFYTGGKVALDQSGRILTTTLDEDVLITNFETGEELARLEGDMEPVTTLALTPGASHLIICSRSYSMRIYSLSPTYGENTVNVKPTLLRSVKAHTAPVIVAETDSTGTLLATGGADGLVKVWDIKGGFVTHNLRGHGGVISAMKFYRPENVVRNERNGRKSSKETTDPEVIGWRLATGADDAIVRVWDLETSKCIAALESHVSVVRGLDWSRDGRTLVSGSRDQVVCVWDAKRLKLKGTIPVLEELETVGILPTGTVNLEGVEGQVLYMGGKKNRIRLWDLSGGKEITQAEDEDEERGAEGIVDILYNPSLNSLISVHNDQTLLTHSLKLPTPNSTNLPVIRRISGHHDEIIDLQYLTPTSSLIALATNSEDVRVLSISNSFSDAGVLYGHSDIVICLDRDWSGYWLATGGKDNEARLWHIDDKNNSFTCHSRYTGHAESIGAIALPRKAPPAESEAGRKFSAPKFMVTGSQDRTIKMWQVGKSKATYTKKAHDKDINAIDTSPDDSMFASASQDRTVKIWSLEEGEVIGVLRGHRRGVWSVKFAPYSITAAVVGGIEGTKGGRMVVTGSGDRTVKLWSLTDYSCLKTFEGHTNSVLKTVWLTGGLQVVSSGGDGLVKVWDVKSGECNTTLDNHEDKVWALAVRPDDQVLVSGGGDSVVTFWTDVTTEIAETTAKEEEAQIEQEQALQNHIHNADYRAAITLALTLNHPGRLLNLFTAVVKTSPAEEGSISGLLAVDEVIGNLANEQLSILMLRIRDWNTNAKTAAVAQRIMHVVFRKYGAQRLLGLKVDLTGWEAILSYTTRHYRKVEELVDESYLVDYTLREMEEMMEEDVEGMDRVGMAAAVVV